VVQTDTSDVNLHLQPLKSNVTRGHNLKLAKYEMSL